MFVRKVNADGFTYQYHYVDQINHRSQRSGLDMERTTTISVVSSDKITFDRNDTTRSLSFEVPFDNAITFEDAEEYVKGLPEFEEYRRPEDAIIDYVKDDLPDEQAATVPEFYPIWQSGEQYLSGDRVRYHDGFYRCIQQHTAQDNWTPSDAPSLWAAIIDSTVPGEYSYPDWVQPESTNPYKIGDQVYHKGKYWESSVDGNVWEPGVFGWFEFEPEPPEPEPEPGPDPEIPEWVQPDSSNPYMTGDRVRFNGNVYESLIDNNVWSPSDYPAGWQLIE